MTVRLAKRPTGRDLVTLWVLSYEAEEAAFSAVEARRDDVKRRTSADNIHVEVQIAAPALHFGFDLTFDPRLSRFVGCRLLSGWPAPPH